MSCLDASAHSNNLNQKMTILRQLLLSCIALLGLFSSVVTLAAPLLISITNAPATVTTGTAGTSQFWPTAGFLDNDSSGTFTTGDVLISLQATLVSISAGDTVTFFTSGDNPVVRANTSTLSSTVLWEVFDANTGLPVSGDPDFLITDIDGNNGATVESVSAACAGLTSYTINGNFLAGCNANSNTACDTNINVSESGGNILAEGTQSQSGTQQEGYMQYSWTGVSSWVVNYFATTSGRWYVHDADGDIPFDGTEVNVNLVDMATIKGVSSGSLTSPAPGQQITFEIEMSNLGPENATGGNLIDTVPVGLNILSASATAGNVSVSGQDVSWSNVDVVLNGIETLTIVAEVDASVAPGTTLTNATTTALANESVCSSRDVLTYPFVVSELPDPSLQVVKSIDPVTSYDAAGDTITYSYLVTNTGNVNIDNVAPTDTGPTFNGATATNALVGFNPASITLAPGVSQTYTATYVLDQTDVDNMAAAPDPLTAIDNTANAAGVPVDGTLATVLDSSVETGFVPEPSLSIVKAVSSATTFSQAGDTITYQYTVSNTGNITIEDVVPTDTGPTFNGAPATNSLSIFSPVSASLAPNTLQVFTATYLLDQADVDSMAAAPDPLTAIDNSASATGDPVGATALPTVTDSLAETGFAPNPSMSVVKSVSTATAFSQAGDTITYQYELANTGNVTINNALPTDTGPTFNGIAGTNSLSTFTPSSVTLDPGAPPVIVTATYVLSQLDIDNMFAAPDQLTAIDNTASATGDPAGGVLPTVPDSMVETGFALDAELALTKSAGVPTVGLGVNAGATDAGDTIAYSFDVTNSGNVSIDNLVINDGGPTFNGVSASGTLSAISCPLTALAPGQMTTCTASYVLSQADVDNAIIGGIDAVENSAAAEGQDPTNSSTVSPDSIANQTIAADSSIEIAKSASAPTTVNGPDPMLVDPGDMITYQLAVDNTGNSTLSSVLISDSIATVTCPATTTLGNPFVNDGSSQLMVGDGIVCMAIYTLQQTDLDAGGVENTADVASTDPSNTPVIDDDTINSGFTQKASLALIKSATTLPDPATAGDSITYTFELTNTGNVTLSAVQVDDAICATPAGPLTFTNGYVSGDAGVAGEMEAGEVWMFECDYAIDQDDVNAGEVANTAIGSGTPPASSGLPDPSNTASNLADAEQNAAIALDKSSSLPSVSAGTLPSATDVGDTISYSFEVENTGNVTLTDVMVTDPLITAAPNNGTIICPDGAGLISSMAPGEVVTCTASYVVTQINIDAGTVTNSANVIGTPPPSVPPADSPEADSSNTVTIAPMPDLQIEKSVAALIAPLQVGDLITYTFVLENTGNVTINNVVPVDSGPTFNGVAATNPLSAFSPLNANLAPGDSQSFTATYTLTQADIDNIAAAADPLTAIDNTASATGMPENGTLPSIDPSSTETGSAPEPEVELVKSSTPPAAVIVGADITYTFTLENTGNVTVLNPIVNDAKCVMPGSVLNFTSGYVSGDNGATAQALDVGEIWQFSCTYPISQADINAGTVANVATGGGQDPSGETIDDDANEDTPLAQMSSWTVNKSTASIPSVVGDTLVYQFLVENTGNVDISGVIVNDAKCASAPVLTSGDIAADLVLSPPETWIFECVSIAVTQTEVDDGMVDNAVDVTGSAPPTAPVLPVAQDTESTPISPMPGLTVEKSSTAPTIGLGAISSATDVGDTIEYSFVVSNTGNVSITALAVSDSGPTFGGSSSSGTWSGVSCPVSSLLPLQSTTCSATYTLSQGDIDNAIAAGPDSVENIAQAQGQDPENNVVMSETDEATTSIISVPMVQILKTAGAATIAGGNDPALTDPGDTVAFNITVENTGNTTLSNVLVEDSLTTLSCPATASPSGAIFSNAGDATSVLAVGDSVVCTASYIINQTDINNGQVINAATVNSTDPADVPVIGVVEEIAPFTQKTSIALIKTASELSTTPAPMAGDLVTYTFTLENTGNVTLMDAQVVDPLCQIPAGPLTSINGLDGATDVGNDGVLDAGEIWTFNCDYAITLADIVAGEITNTATGSGTPPLNSGLDEPSSTSSSLVEAQQNAAITLDKVAGLPTVVGGTLPASSDVGDTVTFTFAIENGGNLPFDTVSLTDPLITDPPNSGSFSCELDGAMTQFTLDADELLPGQGITCTADYVLTQTDVDAGSVANTATVVGDPPGDVPPPPEATSGSMVPIIAEPAMSIAKTASTIPTTVIAGTVITYTYVIENTGNVSIDNAVPVDLGPTFNGAAGTNSLSAYSPAFADLTPGISQTFTATYVISQQDLDNMAAAAAPATAIDNEATADGEPANGSLPPVPPSSVETGVAPDPQLELIKTSTAPTVVAAGAVVSYIFTLENTGNVTISNPVVTDAKCQIPSSPLSLSSGYVSGDIDAIIGSLDVDESWTFSCDYALTQTDIDAGTVQNTAVGSGLDPAGGDVDDDSDSGNAGDDTGANNDPTNTPLIRVPAWTVEKSTDSTPMNLGDTLLYEFLITNTGNVSISNVVVTDAKCVTGVATLVASTDVGADGLISPSGSGGSPAPEQWLYTCTSLPIEQSDLDAAQVDNNVIVSGTAPGGNPTNALDAITTPIITNPAMSLVKSAGLASLNADGSFDQVFNFELKNTGNVTLNSVAITDDIGTQFGACFDSVISQGLVSLTDVTPVADSSTPVLGTTPTIATSASLAVGDSIALNNYIVRFNPNALGCIFPIPAENTATANASPMVGDPITDVSDDGTDPDVGNPNDGGDPTLFTPPVYSPALSSTKSAGVPTLNADGSFDVEYTLLIENVGDVNLTDISVFDDLDSQMGSAFIASSAADATGGVLVAPAVSVVTDASPTNLDLPDGSTDFEGTAASNMFDGSASLLGVGDQIEVTFTVRIDPNAVAAPATFDNTATVQGADPGGAVTEDQSNTETVIPPVSMPALELIKEGVFNSDGTILYTFTVTNVGDVNVTDISISDVIISAFVYDAIDDTDLDSDIDLLVPTQSATITAQYMLTDADIAAGSIENSATAAGTDPSGNLVDDVSDSGNAADDTGADNDPTVTPFEQASIGVAKDVVAGSPVDLGNGSYQVTYQFVISNTGPFDLNSVQLNDDLNQMINNPNVNNATFANPVVSSPNSTLTPNGSYDGSTNTMLLSGSDSLVVGATGLVELTFVFTPDVYFGPFFNQAEVSAQDSAASEIIDLSEDGSTVNPESDSFTPIQISTPSTPINLGWFSSQEYPGMVVFEWMTEVEVSNAGFYLSVKDEQGYWQRINQQMIASQGDSTDSQRYVYTAYDVSGREFILTDVSITGVQVDHGPFVLGTDNGIRSERKQTDWPSIQQESEDKSQERDEQRRKELEQRMQDLKNSSDSRDTSSSDLDLISQPQKTTKNSFLNKLAGAFFALVMTPASAAELVSFEVQEAGLYKVTHAQLVASGLNLTGINTNRISLQQNNQPWPLKVYPQGLTSFNANSYIVFPGQGLNTLYSGINMYTLVLDEGEPLLITEDNTPIPSNTALAPSYLADKTYAPQNHYTNLSPNQEDAWYADSLRAISSPATKTVVLNIDDYAPALNAPFNNGTARMEAPRPRLEVELWGGSNLPGNGLSAPDHHVVIEMNSQQIADERFDGLPLHNVEKVLTNINHGDNQITLSLPKEHGYQFDIVNIDRISIRYPRLFKAVDSGNGLVFESNWNNFRVADLSSNNVTIVRLDESRQAVEMTVRGAGHCAQGCVYFSGSPASEPATYFVATNSGFKTPQIKTLAAEQDIISTQAAALLIAHPDFIGNTGLALEQYMAELAIEYGSADLVNVEDIYAQYSGHVFDASAIQDYIKDAYEARATRHVILVGGDMYDYHDNLQNGTKSFVPSLYVQIASNVNAVPSDAKYADVDNDDVPDITITRLPVRTSSELNILLSKRQTYLTRTYQGKAIFAADKTDSSGYSFKSDSQQAAAQYFGQWDVQSVFLDDVSIVEGKQTIVDSINNGASLTSYYGHSSTDRWSISGLLTSADVSTLSNNNSPTVVAQWGCWNTFYVSPTQDSLAHRFLVNGANGAVTVMGASSFTKAEAERRMADLLYERLNQGMKIGEAVLSAKRALAEDYPYQLDVLLGWAVLGPDDFPIISN